MLSWTNDGGRANPQPVSIKGPQGERGPSGQDGASGDDGGYYTPSVDASGNLSWSASKGGMPTVSGANIRGPQGAKGDTGDTGPQGPQGQQGVQGEPGNDGADGATFTPSVDAAGNLSWTNNGNLENPATVNIKGPKGDKGDTGDTGEQGAPGAPGAAATINGVNALTLAAGENVELEQSGSTLTISASAGGRCTSSLPEAIR